MRKSKVQPYLDVIDKKQLGIIELKKELLEVYTCLYPELGDIIKIQKESLSFLDSEKVNFLVEGATLDMIRDYHKKQIEKNLLNKQENIRDVRK